MNDKAVEKMAEKLCEYFQWDIEGDIKKSKELATTLVEIFFSDPDIPICEYDPDAELPDNVCENDDGKDFTIGYELAQQDMLKAGWVLPVKVKKK